MQLPAHPAECSTECGCYRAEDFVSEPKNGPQIIEPPRTMYANMADWQKGEPMKLGNCIVRTCTTCDCFAMAIATTSATSRVRCASVDRRLSRNRKRIQPCSLSDRQRRKRRMAQRHLLRLLKATSNTILVFWILTFKEIEMETETIERAINVIANAGPEHSLR